MGFGCRADMKSVIMAKNPFLNFPPEFYKNLFAASALYTHHNKTSSSTRQSNNESNNKIFNVQNFPRNLLYSSRDDNEVENGTRESCIFYDIRDIV